MGSRSGDSHGQKGNPPTGQSCGQPGLNRRAFLQKTALVAGSLGLGELAFQHGLPQTAKHYTEAIADTNGRKLALLIGIDNYPKEAVSTSQNSSQKLTGCVTDVSLQKELLVHRFGFLPTDVLCITNAQATREGIYQAFVDHLYQQATSGDRVVIHFSGYGAQVRISDLAGGQAVRRSLVPIDGLVPTEKRPTINDISEAELKGLLKQLKTKNVTTVLDAGFVDIAVPLSGGLRSRTRSEVVTGQLPAPFDLLASKRPLTDADPFPGILIRGADTDDVVLERQWNEFNAGAFTYVFTQHLWSAPAPVTLGLAVEQSKEILSRWGGSNQQPEIIGGRTSNKAAVYDTPLIDNSRGEAVITDISGDGQTATLWLGGLPPRVLEYLSDRTILSCAGKQLKVRSNDGLIGKAKLVEDAKNDGAPLQIGQPVFESLRVLPKNINLVVAIDSRLERIERVDATSALSSLAFVSSTSDTALPADCLLGKPIGSPSETLTASLSPKKLFQNKAISQDTGAETPAGEPAEASDAMGYGLFSLTRSLIPGTLALQDEAIKPAINRLTAKLQSLMALKMLRLSENRSVSQLPVRAVLEEVTPKENKLLISRETFESENDSDRKIGELIPDVPVGTRVRYRLFNDSDVPLYYTLFNVDPRERLSAFCPVAESAAAMEENAEGLEGAIASASIAPGSAVAVPSAGLDWAVDNQAGPVETYVVCSSTPLTETFKLLSAANSGSQRVSPIPNPLDVVRALLSDISQDDVSDAYALDVSQWATLNFTYQAM